MGSGAKLLGRCSCDGHGELVACCREVVAKCGLTHLQDHIAEDGITGREGDGALGLYRERGGGTAYILAVNDDIVQRMAIVTALEFDSANAGTG